MRKLGSGTTYNTHNITSMIRTLKYVSDILQTEEAFTVEEYKHTHTHTHTEELSLMTLKSDAKFKEKLTCGFKYDMRNLVNFHPNTQKSLLPKYTRSELQKYRGVIFHETEQRCKILVNPDLVDSKMA